MSDLIAQERVLADVLCRASFPDFSVATMELIAKRQARALARAGSASDEGSLDVERLISHLDNANVAIAAGDDGSAHAAIGIVRNTLAAHLRATPSPTEPETPR